MGTDEFSSGGKGTQVVIGHGDAVGCFSAGNVCAVK